MPDSSIDQGGVEPRNRNPEPGVGASARGLNFFSYFVENVAETGRGATEECFGQCTYFNRVEKLARSSWLMRMLRNTFFRWPTTLHYDKEKEVSELYCSGLTHASMAVAQVRG